MMQSIASSTDIQSVGSTTSSRPTITDDLMTTHDHEMYPSTRDHVHGRGHGNSPGHVIRVSSDASGNIIQSIAPRRWMSDTMVIKSAIVMVIVFITFPIAFCDIYFAVHDDTCVKQEVGRMVINMKTFLLVSGIYTFSLVGVMCAAICTATVDSSDCTCKIILFYIVGKLNQMFITAWTVVGAILFWSLMNTADCSKQVYNYLFATLIIKIVCVFVQIYSENPPTQRRRD